jgi:hypothetical protein
VGSGELLLLGTSVGVRSTTSNEEWAILDADLAAALLLEGADGDEERGKEHERDNDTANNGLRAAGLEGGHFNRAALADGGPLPVAADLVVL